MFFRLNQKIASKLLPALARGQTAPELIPLSLTSGKERHILRAADTLRFACLETFVRNSPGSAFNARCWTGSAS